MPSDLSLPALNYLERYRNVGTKTYSQHADFTEALPNYRPESSQPTFDLPCFFLPRHELHIWQANAPQDLLQHYISDDQVLFCLHPQLLALLRDDPWLERLKQSDVSLMRSVSTTASTRTLAVQDLAPEHALKVHFPFRISRYARKMRGEVIEQAINASRELEQVCPELSSDFCFLREVLGVAGKEGGDRSERGENWGYLVRDMRPWPYRDGDVSLVPGFALYGRDMHEDCEPLLISLISDRDPLKYVLEQIMLPIIRHWIECFLALGYLLEPHAQNTLLEIDSAGLVRRIVHRDLSVGIDMRRRHDLGLDNRGLNNYNRMDDGTFHSVTYDKFIGHHFFDRLVELCCATWSDLEPEDFYLPCRIEFSRLFPDYKRYMPETVQYFSEQRDEYGKPLYAQTGEPPKWRP